MIVRNFPALSRREPGHTVCGPSGLAHAGWDGQHLDVLPLAQAELVRDMAHLVLDCIVRTCQAQRPNRSYPRVSRRFMDKLETRQTHQDVRRRIVRLNLIRQPL